MINKDDYLCLERTNKKHVIKWREKKSTKDRIRIFFFTKWIQIQSPIKTKWLRATAWTETRCLIH